VTDIDFSSSLENKESYLRLYGVDKYDQVVQNLLNLLAINKKNNNKVRIKILLRQDKPFDKFKSGEVYKKIISYIPESDIEFLDDQWDDFKGIVKKEDLPLNQEFKKQIDKTKPCYALFRKLEVLVDGTIQGCACRVEPALWTENIMNFNNLKSAWNNKTYNKIRSDWFDGKMPSSCDTCSHYIPYTNLNRGNPIKLTKTIIKKVKNKLNSFL
jgi:radical SAM protein with 4Fe4S-binding SPASM domain